MRALRSTLPAAALGLLALATVGYASDEAAERISARATGIVQALEQADAADADARRHLVDTISELPVEDRPAIVHALAHVEEGGSPPARVDVLMDVLDRLGPTAVADVLLTLGGPRATRHDRVLTFWYLRRHPVDHGVLLALHAAKSTPAAELESPRTRSVIRGAVIEILRRDGADWDALGPALRGIDPLIQETFVDAVEKGGFRVSTRALSGLLGDDDRADASILRRLARMPIREAAPLAPAVRARLPGLLQHDDPAVRRLALVVAARYRPEELVAQLIDRLDDPDAAVVATAHRVLRDRSGARLLPEAALWRRWLDGERAWMQKQSKRLEARLGSSDSQDVLSALQTLSAHPLLTAERLPAVEAAAGRGDAAVRREACATLATLGRASAITTLVRLLADEDRQVAAAASEALGSLTGLSGPSSADEWAAELFLDG